MAEQQLRIFEPDPQSFSSIEELESCENNILATLTRVAERKKDLLSNHFSAYDPTSVQIYFEAQEGVPTSFENEVAASWLPTDNVQNPTQICVGSEPSCLRPSSRGESGAMFEIPMSHGTDVNVDPFGIGLGGCQIGHETSEGLPSWHHNCTTTDQLLSAFMSPNSSLCTTPINNKIGITGPSFTPMMPQLQIEAVQGDPHIVTGGEVANYQSDPHIVTGREVVNYQSDPHILTGGEVANHQSNPTGTA
ncbi:hypothetical protein L484_020136 [Morus notabilis]|uniref:Uncharacterized protein n=1 Tax=Morus notabilis TaxID=981085 RepID=W9RBH3_9ROSA|nr:hypothetical protein L484_020136 [Morus notabilis]